MSRDVFFRFIRYLSAALVLSVTVAACGATDLKDSGNKPFPPDNLVATAAAPGTVEVILVWEAVFRADSYNVYWILESDLEEGLEDVATPTADIIKAKIAEIGTKIPSIKKTTYTHTGLTGSVTYYYVVTAVTRNGEGKPSNAANAMPIDKPLPPIVTGTTPTVDAFPIWTWESGGLGNGNYRYKLDDIDLTVDAVATTELTYITPEPGVPNGLYTLYVQEVNDEDKWSDSGFFEILVDGPIPEKPILIVEHVPADHLTKTTDQTPKWSWEPGGGGNGTYRYKIDDDDLTVDSVETTDLSFIPTEALLDGTHTFYIQERDNPGNWSLTASQEIIVDSTPPTAPVVTGDVSPTLNTTPTWSWVAGGGDGNGTFRYKIDDAVLTTGATETTDLTYISASLGDGSHTLYVQERDEIGNWSESGLYEIIIDTTAPSAPGTPTDVGEYTASTTVTFTWTPGADNQSGVSKYTLQVGTTAGGSNIFDGDVGDVLTKDIAGSHGQTLYARVQAVNGVDLIGAWSGNSDGITIDTTAPSAPGTPTDAGDYSLVTTVTFNWAAAADAESGVVSYTLQVGTSAGASDVFDGDVGNVLTKDVTGTNGDTLYARVLAVNGAGTDGAWSGNSNGIMIDTTSPGKPGTPTDAGLYSGTTTVTFDWTAATDDESGVASYNLQVGTSAGASDVFNGDVGDVLTKIVTGTNGDTLYARAQAVNNAGSPVGDWSANSDGILIDTSAPSIPGDPTDIGAYSTSTIVTFDWTASIDAGSGVSSYWLTVGSSAGASDVFSGDVGNVLTYNVAGSLGQTLYAKVKAVNGAGLESVDSGNSDGILIDTTAPGLPGTPTDAGDYISVTNPVTFNWTAATDGESGVASYEIQVGTSPGGNDVLDTTDLGNVLTYDATGADGSTLYIRVRAINNAGLTGDWSDNSDGITIDTSVPGSPGTPSDIGLWSTSTAVTFDWTAGADAGSGIVSYNLQVGTAPGGNDVYDGNVGNVLTKQVTSVDTNTLYARVQSVNGATLTSVWSGNSDGITIDVTKSTVPGTPTDGPAEYSQSTTVSFIWNTSTDVGGSGVASYDLQVGTSAGGSDIFDGNVGNVLTYDATGAEDTTLYARVRSIDVAGNDPSSWSGNSDGIHIDTISPTVTAGTPSSGATAIDLDTTITGTFSEDMISGTVNNTNITLADAASVTGGVVYGTKTFTFTPTAWLDPKTTHTITLDTAPTDLAGNALVTNNWSFTTRPKLVAMTGGSEDAASGDNLGFSVAISGDYLVVGAPEENGMGAVYVFKRNTTWGTGTKLIAGNAGAGDKFGYSVAISGNYLIVGAPYEDTVGADAGAVYNFKLTTPATNSWTQQQIITGAVAGDHYGWSVGIDDVAATYAIVGAPDNTSSQGAAYILLRTGDSFAQEDVLTATFPANGDMFGYSVAISDTNAVVGAPYGEPFGTDVGEAYTFNRVAGPAWDGASTLLGGLEDNGHFGWSVGINGSYLVVGAPDEDGTSADSGKAYTFMDAGTNAWGTRATLTASDQGASDAFGYSVGITGNALVVGSYLEDASGADAGAAYTFILTNAPTNAWSSASKISDATIDVAAGDNFGTSVAIDGSYTVIGSPFEDPNTINNAGAGYILY